MYKIIEHKNKKVEIQEHFRSPMVYLDHWALNDLSLNPDLRDRFVRAMNDNGGTLRLSVVNMTELSKQADLTQVESILNMIRSIEDCGLINIDPSQVINKENKLISDPEVIFQVKNPSADLDLILEHLKAGNHSYTWHVSDIIASVIDELSSRRLSKSNDKFLLDTKHLLETGRNDTECLERAKNRFKRLKKLGPKYQAATRELLQLTVDFVMRNKNMKMGQYSEWNDIFHLIVPVAYCDIVMLDKRWTNFLDQVGFSFPKIAMVFNKRSIESMFEQIENWGKANKSNAADAKNRAAD